MWYRIIELFVVTERSLLSLCCVALVVVSSITHTVTCCAVVSSHSADDL